MVSVGTSQSQKVLTHSAEPVVDAGEGTPNELEVGLLGFVLVKLLSIMTRCGNEVAHKSSGLDTQPLGCNEPLSVVQELCGLRGAGQENEGEDSEGDCDKSFDQD